MTLAMPSLFISAAQGTGDPDESRITLTSETTSITFEIPSLFKSPTVQEDKVID